MAEHTVNPCGCAVCGMRSHPRWLYGCPGVPWYDWAAIPEHLATKTQLQREGLRVAGDPLGCYIVWSRKQLVLLYDRGAATPKRALSEKQQVALKTAATALKASRTCRRCGRLVQSKRKLYDTGDTGHAGDAGGRLCVWCYELWEHEQEAQGLYRWAAQLLAGEVGDTGDGAGRPVRILDTETTGLDDDAEVIEIAVVDAQSGHVLVDTLERPQGAIPPDATAIHGLTAANVASAPSLPDVWPQVVAALRGTRVVAYNAPFDSSMLRQSAKRNGLKRPECRWECLMEACTALSDDGERWLSLEAVCWELGVAGGGHRALGDALAALDVLRALAARASAVVPAAVPAAVPAEVNTR